MERNATATNRTTGLASLAGEGALVGLVAGLGAAAFRALIALFHQLAFAGRASVSYDANRHTAASPWGPLVVLVPVVGAFLVAVLVKKFAPEAKGHGVPEVMDAIYYRGGFIRPVVAVVKSLASSLSIGTGGSVGREGPIAQIGAAFGSTLAARLGAPAWERVTLVAAGAGAGIAATFNTPIGGLLFAVELMLVEVSGRTLLPVALAVAVATLVGRAFFGLEAAFVVPRTPVHVGLLFDIGPLVAFVLLGVLAGAVGALFTRAIYWCEDLFDRVPGGYYVRHPLGMLLVGATMYGLYRATGHYYVEGVGYATVQDVLDGKLAGVWFPLALLAAKLLVTSVTLGSGASGGVFSPSLFLGATLGGAFGIVVDRLVPSLGGAPLAFAIAGMVGVVGAATGATLAAITLIFEMTRDYQVVLPMIVCAAAAHAVRLALVRDSIYTLKLSRRGQPVPQTLLAEFALSQRAWSTADPHVAHVVPTLDAGAALRAAGAAGYLLVERAGETVGVVPREALLEAVAAQDARPITAVMHAFAWLSPDASLRDAHGQLRTRDLEFGLVSRGDEVRVVSLGSLARAQGAALVLLEAHGSREPPSRPPSGRRSGA